MADLSGVHLRGKHVIISASVAQDRDVIDRIFYCKYGFGCHPTAAGTKIYGQFMTEPTDQDIQLRREDVLRLATNEEIEQARQRLWAKVKDEVCTCGHLKSQHAGLNGHGICTEEGCECAQFTWEKWVLK